MLQVTERECKARIIDLLSKRSDSGTICPSEVARSFSNSPTVWRPLMEPVRAAARQLVAEGQIEITQKGHAQTNLEHLKGPIRLRRVLANDLEP